jgi:hypothetical protein
MPVRLELTTGEAHDNRLVLTWRMRRSAHGVQRPCILNQRRQFAAAIDNRQWLCDGAEPRRRQGRDGDRAAISSSLKRSLSLM